MADRLRLRRTPTGVGWFGGEVSERPMNPVDATGEIFVTGNARDTNRRAAVFLTIDGRRYLHFGLRSTPQVAS